VSQKAVLPPMNVLAVDVLAHAFGAALFFLQVLRIAPSHAVAEW
jgi:hypothetical protein